MGTWRQWAHKHDMGSALAVDLDRLGTCGILVLTGRPAASLLVHQAMDTCIDRTRTRNDLILGIDTDES